MEWKFLFEKCPKINAKFEFDAKMAASYFSPFQIFFYFTFDPTSRIIHCFLTFWDFYIYIGYIGCLKINAKFEFATIFASSCWHPISSKFFLSLVTFDPIPRIIRCFLTLWDFYIYIGCLKINARFEFAAIFASSCWQSWKKKRFDSWREIL